MLRLPHFRLDAQPSFGDEIQKYRETHPREEQQPQQKTTDEKLTKLATARVNKKAA